MSDEKVKSITLPDDLWEKLKVTAYAAGRNQKGHIRILIERGLEAEENDVKASQDA